MITQVYEQLKPKLPKGLSYEQYHKILLKTKLTYPETIRTRVDELTILYMINKYNDSDTVKVSSVGFNDSVGCSDF